MRADIVKYLLLGGVLGCLVTLAVINRSFLADVPEAIAIALRNREPLFSPPGSDICVVDADCMITAYSWCDDQCPGPPAGADALSRKVRGVSREWCFAEKEKFKAEYDRTHKLGDLACPMGMVGMKNGQYVTAKCIKQQCQKVITK